MLAWRRIAAFAVDYLLIVTWAIGIALVTLSLMGGEAAVPSTMADKMRGHALAFVTMTVPVVAYFAIADGARGTLGKRALGLVPMATKGQAWGRSVLKFLPWEIAHIGIWYGGERPFLDPPGPLGLGLSIAAMLVAALYVLGLFFGDGRPLYDRVTGSDVRRKPS